MSFCNELKQYHEAYPLFTQTVMGKPFPYRLLGSGERALVFLPGAMASSDGYCRHSMELAEYFTVLTFDYPQCYKTNAEMADAIIELLGILGIQKAVFVGQSYGGFLAQIITVRHPGKVEGLILSNTGSLYESMNEGGKAGLYAAVASFKRLILLMWFVPVAFLRKKLLKRAMVHLEDFTEEERVYFREVFTCLYRRLTNKGQRHLFGLMADLQNVPPMRFSEFEFLSRKTLLFLSPDDETFGDGVIRGLIDMMSEPRIVGELKGGHTAPLLNREAYVRIVTQFMQSL